MVTAYTLSFGGLLLLGGRIADYVGRKRMFIIGLLGFAGASALGGVALNSAMLFGARALQGAFAALLAPAALSLISVTFTEVKERATAFGVYGAISGGGAAIGLIMGGVLTEYASWRWCLLVNVPIAVVAALAAVPVVRESKAHGNTSYDIPGAVTVTAGLVALVYGFTKAASDGWAATATLSFLGIAVVLLAAFVIIEIKSKNPLLPMRVILERNRGGSFLSSFMVGAGLLGMFLFLTYYFQGNLGYSALKSGFAFLPFSAGIIVAAGASSKLLPRFGPRPLMAVGFGAAALGHAVAEPDHPPHHLPGPRPAGRDPDQPGHGPGLRAHEQHRPVPGAGPRCRGVQRPGQHHPTGGRLPRDRPPEHRGRLGHRHLPADPGPHPGQRGGGPGPRLHGGLPGRSGLPGGGPAVGGVPGQRDQRGPGRRGRGVRRGASRSEAA